MSGKDEIDIIRKMVAEELFSTVKRRQTYTKQSHAAMEAIFGVMDRILGDLSRNWDQGYDGAHIYRTLEEAVQCAHNAQNLISALGKGNNVVVVPAESRIHYDVVTHDAIYMSRILYKSLVKSFQRAGVEYSTIGSVRLKGMVFNNVLVVAQWAADAVGRYELGNGFADLDLYEFLKKTKPANYDRELKEQREREIKGLSKFAF